MGCTYMYRRKDCCEGSWPSRLGESQILSWVLRDYNQCVIALQITDPSSRQRGRPTWRRKKLIVTQRNLKSGHLPQRGPETKTNWPTGRRSQYNSNSMWGIYKICRRYGLWGHHIHARFHKDYLRISKVLGGGGSKTERQHGARISLL
jgi:hypothetical protein